MTMIHVSIPGVGKREIRKFRDENSFEAVDAYVESTLIPFILDNVPEARAIRCSISGWLIGYYSSDETAATIRQAVVATNFRRFNPLLESFTSEQLIDAIETLIDQVTMRVLILSRPSPIFTGAIGKQAMDTAPRTRQLISLLNQLIFDNGGFRRRETDSFEIVANLRRAAKLADTIRQHWDGSFDSQAEDANQYQDLYSGLVELDAKWTISRLTLTKKEAETLAILAEAPTFDVNRVRNFVWQMVVLRDQETELSLSESWTLKAYRTIAASEYDSVARAAMGKSNLKMDKGPSNAHIKRKASATSASKSESNVTKKSKSKNEKVHMFADIFASMSGFGSETK